MRPRSFVASLVCAATLPLAACGGAGDDTGAEAPTDGGSGAPPATGLIPNNTLAVAGVTRYFDYYRPSGLSAQAPAVILLHGGGLNRTQVIDGTTGTTRWLDVAEAEQVLLIIPNGADAAGNTDAVSASWNDCRSDQSGGSTRDDVAFISALIDWALAREDMEIDPARVYVTGSSNGGMMSYRAALELDHRVAAVAAFIANQPANLDPACAEAVGAPDPNPVSVFIGNGTDDVLMPFNGGAVAFGNGGQVVSTSATRDLWRARNETTQVGETVTFSDLDPTDGSRVTRVTFTGGEEGSEVALFVVEGGGHSVPSMTYLSAGDQNRDLEGVDQAWTFLRDKRL